MHLIQRWIEHYTVKMSDENSFNNHMLDNRFTALLSYMYIYVF